MRKIFLNLNMRLNTSPHPCPFGRVLPTPFTRGRRGFLTYSSPCTGAWEPDPSSGQQELLSAWSRVFWPALCFLQS